jgi:hypothetical protein
MYLKEELQEQVKGLTRKIAQLKMLTSSSPNRTNRLAQGEVIILEQRLVIAKDQLERSNY